MHPNQMPLDDAPDTERDPMPMRLREWNAAASPIPREARALAAALTRVRASAREADTVPSGRALARRAARRRLRVLFLLALASLALFATALLLRLHGL